MNAPTPTRTTARSAADRDVTGTTMRAVVQDRYGDIAEVLRTERIERPVLGADEVLVEVAAAGVDRGAWHLVTGRPYAVRLAGYGVLRPKHRTPGSEVAGRVVEVGASVSRFSVGDRVFGVATGAFAEYAAVPQDKLAIIPDGVSDEQAATAAVSGSTALQALSDVGGVRAGQRVLVVGASGGVGTFAVQLAAALGAHVTAVAGTANLGLVRSLGAEEVIDHRHEAIDARGGGYDLVVDIGGRNRLSRLRRVLAADGTLVIVGGEGGNRVTGGAGRQLRALLLSRFVGQRLMAFISREHFEPLERLAPHLASGAVVPVVGARFTLDDVSDALTRFESGHSAGKSVVLVGKSSDSAG